MEAYDKKREEEVADEGQPPADLLNENHRRVLSGTLRRLELAAWSLEDQLAQRRISSARSHTFHTST